MLSIKTLDFCKKNQHNISNFLKVAEAGNLDTRKTQTSNMSTKIKECVYFLNEQEKNSLCLVKKKNMKIFLYQSTDPIVLKKHKLIVVYLHPLMQDKTSLWRLKNWNKIVELLKEKIEVIVLKEIDGLIICNNTLRKCRKFLMQLFAELSAILEPLISDFRFLQFPS